MQAVFDPPMLANVPQEVGGGDVVWIEAAHVVTRIMQQARAIFGEQLTIDAQRNATTG